MITVYVTINGSVIMARSARNTGVITLAGMKYDCDDGTVIYHHRDDGAKELAKKMLDTVKEI